MINESLINFADISYFLCRIFIFRWIDWRKLMKKPCFKIKIKMGVSAWSETRDENWNFQFFGKMIWFVENKRRNIVCNIQANFLCWQRQNQYIFLKKMQKKKTNPNEAKMSWWCENNAPIKGNVSSIVWPFSKRYTLYFLTHQTIFS